MARKNVAFPQVLKNTKNGSVVIIYWDRAEYYGGPHIGVQIYRGDDGQKFDPYNELENIALGNGYRFVHQARDNHVEKDAYTKKLEDQIDAMKNQCPEGGCLVEVSGVVDGLVMVEEVE